jgi:hypothetical protein
MHYMQKWMRILTAHIPNPLADISGSFVDFGQLVEAAPALLDGGLADVEHRRRLLPPGIAKLGAIEQDNYEHMVGLAPEGSSAAFIFLRRVPPELLELRRDEVAAYNDPNKDEEALQIQKATEMITIFENNGDVTNVVVIPSPDLADPCVKLMSTTISLADFGWTDGAVLEQNKDDMGRIRNEIDNEVWKLQRGYPYGWNELDSESAAKLASEIDALVPVEY